MTQLTYRGTTHVKSTGDAIHSVAPKELRYRGHSYRAFPLTTTSTPRKATKMTYRGITY